MRVSDLAIDRIYINKLARKEHYETVDNHFHYYYELFYVFKGNCRIFVNNYLYDLHAGDFVVIPPNAAHHVSYITDATRLNLYFRNSDIADADGTIRETIRTRFLENSGIIHIPGTHRSTFEQIFADMLLEDKVDDSDTKELLSLIFKALLIMACRSCIFYKENALSKDFVFHHTSESDAAGQMLSAVEGSHMAGDAAGNATATSVGNATAASAGNVPGSAPAFIGESGLEILQAAKYISDHYWEQITLDMLAKQVNLSTGYFSRKFREVTGMGMKEYLIYVRLRHASYELLSTNHSITEVSANNGFSNSNYFKDVFKKMFGMSPRAYRASKTTDLIMENALRTQPDNRPAGKDED